MKLSGVCKASELRDHMARVLIDMLNPSPEKNVDEFTRKRAERWVERREQVNREAAGTVDHGF
jgi:hypothetical protein